MRRRSSIATKIIWMFLGALLLNGASIIAIHLYQTEALYRSEYDREIREIAARFLAARSDPANPFGVMTDFNQLSTYRIYLKLAYEQTVDAGFMSAANVNTLRQTPNQTTVINQNGNRYIAAIFPYSIDSENAAQNPSNPSGVDELLVMKQFPLWSERSTQILTYSLITFLVLSPPLLILLFIVLRRFTKPIVEMNAISEAYAEGDFSRKLTIRTNDEIGQLGMSLNEMAVRLKAKEEARDTFLAGVSHELRTPLTTLKANTRGIIEGIVPTDKVHHFLASNIEEIDRMIRMVNDLILVSTFEENLTLHVERVDVQSLLDSVLQSMKLLAQTKQVSFRVNVDDAPELLADQAKLKQVLINVLHNAFRYSPEKGHIHIYLKSSDSDVHLLIRDEGDGFSEAQRAHVFERFQRSVNSSGLGLGLYISQQIIKAHHGSILAANHPAGGACVEIILPKH